METEAITITYSRHSGGTTYHTWAYRAELWVLAGSQRLDPATDLGAWATREEARRAIRAAQAAGALPACGIYE